jgi:hypothetical protein
VPPLDSTTDLQFDDDQCKTQNERLENYWFSFEEPDFFFYRNLALIRHLDEQPFLWISLEIIFIGWLLHLFFYLINKSLFLNINAFQLCLPIIRCLLSTLIVEWENFRDEDWAKNYIKQLTLN